MTTALLGAFSRPAGVAGTAAMPAATPGEQASQRLKSSKPHQNPAFPAAFVFQSHSASFLAADTRNHSARRDPAGS